MLINRVEGEIGERRREGAAEDRAARAAADQDASDLWKMPPGVSDLHDQPLRFNDAKKQATDRRAGNDRETAFHTPWIDRKHDLDRP